MMKPKTLFVGYVTIVLMTMVALLPYQATTLRVQRNKRPHKHHRSRRAPTKSLRPRHHHRPAAVQVNLEGGAYLMVLM